jgi:hypothetical protein
MDQILRGVQLSPVEGQPRTWEYRALQPNIALTEDGRAQFTMIAAGSITMLSLTTMWGVNAETLEAIRAELAAANGCTSAQVVLTPSRIEANTVALQFGDGSGAFETVATAKSSGAPPYHAAFSLMLDAAQAEKARNALAGKAGWLAVRYALTGGYAARGETAAARDTSASIDVSLQSGGDSARATACASETMRANSERKHDEALNDFAFADAADWALPRG